MADDFFQTDQDALDAFSDTTGLGALLRQERENRGLSPAQVSDMTRLRPYQIEALENEDWDRLPSPVFVAGFIRSYARALELDEENLLALYREETPAEISPPKPLSEPGKERKALSIVIVLLLVALGFGYYFWKNYPDSKVAEVGTLEKEAVTPERVPADSPGAGPIEPRAQLEPEGEGEETAPKIATPEKPGASEPGTFLSPGERSASLPEAAPETVTPAPAPGAEVEEEAESLESLTSAEYTLEARVTERTWLKIFVDGQEPEEYIFSPGSKPRWEAQEGFELIIGNAGGIHLELNDETLGALGEPGQVVRLSLPEGYESPEAQD